MSKVLGLDLGTNSIGWAIIERDGSEVRLLDKGVNIFQEGVNRVKGNEEPSVKTRTEARASRRHYFRRRLRKIELLKVLIEQSWCPYLSEAELKEWREKKLFPLNPDFLDWLRTDDEAGQNPYYDRHRCLSEELDLTKIKDRYALGRALYHINQRRGFLSNRKDQSSSKEDGKVKSAIKDLDLEMAEAGYAYIGEFFYHLYKYGVKVRKRYTDRKEHYEKEFRAICEKQHIDSILTQLLYDAIFLQRPLKSQKGLVGKCPFEKGKSRCQLSHPDFEEFRMLSFVNNIRIAMPGELDMRPLTEEEKSTISPLFFRKSKENFDFSEISKKLVGKKTVIKYGAGNEGFTIDIARFNFRDTTNVSGCPVTAQLMSIFGDHWRNALCEQYMLANGKSVDRVVDDVWHALTFFNDDEKLAEWAKTKLQLSNQEAKAFVDIKLPQGYASLSLCAIRKILPWLRSGYRYDEASMLANIKSVVPKSVWNDKKSKEEVMDVVNNVVTSYIPSTDIKNDSKMRKIEEELSNLGIFDLDMDKLYHPSMIEVYPKSMPDKDGKQLLKSPRIDAIRNPMAMRALFRLRAIVNELLKDSKIDSNTKVNIELSRNLNDFNMRRAIDLFQRDNEKRRQEYRKALLDYYSEQGIQGSPSDDDLLKYELWEEQNHICLYTGKQIPLSGFLGPNPQFDIEHTVPRSMGGDNSKANKTLCECRFNREIKKGRLPSELASWEQILARVAGMDIEDKIESLRKEIAKASRSSKAATDKDTKDKAIQKKHLAKMRLDYYMDKLRRFSMKEIPEGFSNKQGVDIGIIGRYARMYMQSVFESVYTVKGETTAEFRKMWGLQDVYGKKERVNHTHHCIDAITIACIGKAEYDRWAQFKREEDKYIIEGGRKPEMPKPWKTFTEDVKSVSESLLVSHHTPDNMTKQSRKIVRKRGVIKRNAKGGPMYAQGDTARGSLHLQTYYGAIKIGDEVRYVIRKELTSLSEKDIDNIVDNVVREKVRAAKEEGGMAALQADVWMNKEKGIPIRKVRLYAPSVTSPITLKKQRFESPKDYKRDVYVVNESNFAYAVYEGRDSKGKVKRSFKVINNLEAATLSKSKSRVIPEKDTNGYDLLFSLKTGTMVLFYENNKEELYNASESELSRRLYKTMKFSVNSIVYFIHCREARQKSEIEFKNGVWIAGEPYRPIMAMGHNQIKALVEGYDFKISAAGKITFLEK